MSSLLQIQNADPSFKLLPALSKFSKTQNNQFSVLSWNILIKDYHYKYYGYLSAQYKEWDYRLPLIHKTITNFNSDIICLQEAHLPSFQQDIADYFKINGNYQTILNNKLLIKNKKKKKRKFVMTMTTPILFKNDKFKLIYTDFRSKAYIALLQFIDITNDNQSINNDINDIKNDNNDNQSESYIWIVNVHLEGDPTKPDVRFAQIKKILNRITTKTNEFKLNLNKIHIIITGDFNAEKGEVVDTVLLNGCLAYNYRQLPYNDIDIVKSKNNTDYKHIFKFLSAYDNIKNNLNRSKIKTFYARNSRSCIDHMYYTSNNTKCLLCMETVPNWLSKDKNLQCPNDKLVSDHLPIAAMFQINYNINDQTLIN